MEEEVGQMLNIDDWLNDLEKSQEEQKEFLKTHKLNRELKSQKKKNKELLHSLETSEDRENLLLSLSHSENNIAPIRAWKGSAIAEATAVVLASDWHVEENIDPETINGLNEYNLAIAEERARNFFKALLWKIQSARVGQEKGFGYQIDNLILWLGGDMISGYIHEELLETNFLSPIEAILFCSNLIQVGINFLLKEGNFKRILIPCSFGNHGRCTPKRKHSSAAKNSYEWLMYHQLKQLYENEDRIEFKIANGSLLYLDVYDWVLRFHHGDDIRYGGGKAGMAGPLKTAVDNWNIGKYADISHIGHFHQFLDENFAVVNGSLCGYNAFSQSIKARYEPPRQAFYLIDKDRGKIDVSPLYVDSKQRRMPSGKSF
jgi:hypothetical protein